MKHGSKMNMAVLRRLLTGYLKKMAVPVVMAGAFLGIFYGVCRELFDSGS